jgi:perosamine synthetase
MARDDISAYRQAIAAYLDMPPEHVTLFWKGRVAFSAILEALGIAGGEVLIPAFTCVVVPNAILYAGARPVYLEIEPVTFHVDLARLESRITPRTRAILAQNTFGLAPPMDELRAVAARRGLALIEDCAHGFGGTYRGRKNGTLADASFFSTQWNKPFSTGLGGIAVTGDPALAARLREIEGSVASPSARERATLGLLLNARAMLGRPEVFALAAAAYRALGRTGIVPGSSDSSEVAGTERPEGFLKGLSDIQARAGLRGIAKIDADNGHRRAIAEIYHRALERMGVPRPLEPPHARHTFLKYPVFVRDRDGFLQLGASRGIALSDWFRSPIHPVTTGWEKWLYEAGSNPVAEERSRSCINLPTQPGVTAAYATRVVEFLDRNRDRLLG